jgi:hypothetical protein
MKEDKPHKVQYIYHRPAVRGFFCFYILEGIMKNTLHNIFLAVGLGTIIFTPLLIIDNGLNDTMVSVIIWLLASIVYGLTFSILRMKSIFRIPLHFIACFAVTMAVRFVYAYFSNGEIEFKKTFIVTVPIFIVIYIIMFFYMKYFGNSDGSGTQKEE